MEFQYRRHSTLAQHLRLLPMAAVLAACSSQDLRPEAAEHATGVVVIKEIDAKGVGDAVALERVNERTRFFSDRPGLWVIQWIDARTADGRDLAAHLGSDDPLGSTPFDCPSSFLPGGFPLRIPVEDIWSHLVTSGAIEPQLLDDAGEVVLHISGGFYAGDTARLSGRIENRAGQFALKYELQLLP